MYLSPVYERYYTLLMSNEPRKMVLLPRGSFKSTAMCASIMRDIVINPNARILYASETGKLAKYYLGWIRSQFESNGAFREIFGDYVSKKGWGSEQLWVSARTDLSKKEPTLTACGMKQIRSGPHYEHIYVDDPVSNKNSNTADALALTIEQYTALEFIAEDEVDPETGKIMTSTSLMLNGTRYDDMDVYGHILRQNQALKEGNELGGTKIRPYKVFVCPAETPEGELPFAHLTREVLDKKKAKAPEDYPSQMLLDPVPPGTALFQREQFRLISPADIPKREYLWTYLLTDTATSEGREDDTVLAVIGKDCIGNVYVLDMLVRQMKPSDVVEGIFSLYSKWGCRKVLMEKIAINECYAALIEARTMETQTRIRTESVGGRTSDSKYNRIRSLQGRFQSGKIFFSNSLPKKLISAVAGKCFGDIVEEFIKFPKSKLHDDIPDCLSDMDKQDLQGAFLCPMPTRQTQKVVRPGVVNGRIANPGAVKPSGDGNFWGTLRKQL